MKFNHRKIQFSFFISTLLCISSAHAGQLRVALDKVPDDVMVNFYKVASAKPDHTLEVSRTGTKDFTIPDQTYGQIIVRFQRMDMPGASCLVATDHPLTVNSKSKLVIDLSYDKDTPGFHPLTCKLFIQD